MARPPWERLADALLQREAIICRLGEGVPPRDLAGWFVAPEDVDRILRTLPGLDGPAPELAAPLREQLDAHVADAREEFAASLIEESVMPDLARRARLSEAGSGGVRAARGGRAAPATAAPGVLHPGQRAASPADLGRPRPDAGAGGRREPCWWLRTERYAAAD